ncbi:FHA domain-containing protein [Pseudonocardia acaciae]|uniref:FHA domain-containing protein n=1 Tax=Pseudonocardia acaciae TaxID=551276 RepID=UPI00055EB49E|nr:FHA domain-containing protein [Pseudonocardia acaciae]
MTQVAEDRPGRSPVQLLPPETGSLARGIPDCPPGTLFALARRGGIRVAPTARFDVVFGRNEPEVHVSVGENDPAVSRRHGLLHCDGSRWTIRNTGLVPIRFPGSQLLLSGQEQPLPASYTPLFIRTEPGREHLLEIRIASAPTRGPWARPDDATRQPPTWELSARERLVLVALGQRYLRHEAHPQPRSWHQVADELAELQPSAGWTPKTAEHIVRDVRTRLAGTVVGLTRDEVGEPVGNALNHNLLLELLISTTLVPPDLRLLSAPSGPDGNG